MSTDPRGRGERRLGRLAGAGLVAVAVGSFLVTGPLGAIDNPTSTIFINEVHYDNVGTDTGESIEIAGPSGTDLAGWTLQLYNGNGGAVYTTTPLTGVIADQDDGAGVLAFAYPTNGIQNGSPDGIALVDAGGTVIQFLSYEGTVTAVGGAADGLTSTEIGVTETGTTPVGTSMQLTGTGTTFGDFTWVSGATASPGAVNDGQDFVGPPPTTAPVTTAPPTTAPVTTAPPTTAPVTSAPATTAPPTVPSTATPTSTGDVAPAAPSSTTSVPVGGTLPATGSSSSWPLGALALVVVTLGAGMARVARRH